MTDDPEIILTAKEYETVTDSYREELAQGRHGKDLLKSPTDGLEKCPHTLGAHFIGNTLQAYWFVGQVRLTDRIILKVKPKIDGLDFGRMYLRCLADPIVNAHLNDCFWFFWDQPDIPQLKGQTLTLLIISAYLKKFGELCRRHLRRHFIRVEENLTRKVRGKPLIQQQIRTNMVRHRMDRVYCQYQINSLDSRENQILKAALDQSVKYLHHHLRGIQAPYLWTQAALARSTLESVRLRRIFPQDFTGLRYTGLMRPYKEPHRLARLILRLLGSDPTRELTDSKKDIEVSLPPYAIDMNELFERYCEARLRQNPNYKNIWAGYKDTKLGVDKKNGFIVRPDFLVIDQGAIVDAKYKVDWPTRTDIRQDIYQVMAYSCHEAVRDKIKQTKKDIFILYPPNEGGKDTGNEAIELHKNEHKFAEDFVDPQLFAVKVNL